MPIFPRGEGLVKADGVLFKQRLVFGADLFISAAPPVEEAVARKPGGDERDYRAVVPPHAEHGAYGVLVPALFQAHRAAHDPVGAHEIFELFVYVRDVPGRLAELYVVKPQDVAYGVARRAAVAAERVGKPAARGRAGDVGKAVGKDLVVAELALPYLLVKPAHLITPIRWK